ncbi:hypothetical protein IJ818_06930 [bacterium]|nr:hypothetical protein [bacterium]
MTYNVGLQSHKDVDVKALKTITNDIFENASSQSYTPAVKVRTVTGIDLYSGKVDSDTARHIAISNSGLQVQINNNLAAKLQFLNAKAAANTLQETSTAIAGVASQVIEELKSENPFANKFSATNKKTGYLFIKAA